VVVRADLPKGLQAAQIVHAAGESSPGSLPDGTHAVVLAVPDEPALRCVSARLKLARVPFVAITETDAPFAGQLMALGLTPQRKEDVRRFVSSLPLLR
jgi:peptidyl-tRNA hydrolase